MKSLFTAFPCQILQYRIARSCAQPKRRARLADHVFAAVMRFSMAQLAD
jgi:hypothetical protein